MSTLHERYVSNLELAREFEDFVYYQLAKVGFNCYMNRSRKYQLLCGSDSMPLEVKLDRKFQETRNLFIETEERHSAEDGVPFKPSGIFGPAILFAIGDQTRFWVFPTRWLRRSFYRISRLTGKPIYERTGTPTAKGFLLPLADMEQDVLVYDWPPKESPG